ncbi:MAG: FHA domain-containing protein [Ilumatobacter sp.]|nr:FHA domain-containing protein [Ilumatobacter sp.]
MPSAGRWRPRRDLGRRVGVALALTASLAGAVACSSDEAPPSAPDGTTRPAAAAGPPPKHRAKRGVPTRLVVLQPRVRKGSAYPIGVEITLGRAPSCSIGLPDDTFASQLHARVFTQDGGVWVEDLGSTNGTHLNGGRVTAPTALVQGDRVQVGNTIFEAQ